MTEVNATAVTSVEDEKSWTDIPSSYARRAVAKTLVGARAVKGAAHGVRQDAITVPIKHRLAVRKAKKAFWNEQVSQRGL